mmetsp:Transcript_111601/g.280770  ORF Transcript_111601/g.280770 Transcript_111601/m.280770 type:complete len:251 (+) Transcript_111601:244-996(+)
MRVRGVHGLDEARRRTRSLDEAAAEVTRGRARVGRAAVVGAVVVDDFCPPCEATSNADRRLVGLGAPRREEETIQVSRQEFGEQRRQADADLRVAKATIDHRQLCDLLVDGADHRGRHVVAQVRADRLASPVQVLVAIDVEEVDSLAVRQQWNLSHGAAGTPSGHDMLLRVRLQFLLRPALLPMVCAYRRSACWRGCHWRCADLMPVRKRLWWNEGVRSTIGYRRSGCREAAACRQDAWKTLASGDEHWC